jgi:hypothetical protein
MPALHSLALGRRRAILRVERLETRDVPAAMFASPAPALPTLSGWHIELVHVAPADPTGQHLPTTTSGLNHDDPAGRPLADHAEAEPAERPTEAEHGETPLAEHEAAELAAGRVVVVADTEAPHGDTLTAIPLNGQPLGPRLPARATTGLLEVPLDLPHLGTVAAPVYVALPVALAASPAAHERGGLTWLGGGEHSVTNDGRDVVPGVPAPTEIASATLPDNVVIDSLPVAPPETPWLADLLTPSVSFTVGEPFVALQRMADGATGWSQAVLGQLGAWLSSPWVAGTALVVAAAGVFGWRRQQAGWTASAPEVPDVTSPRQLS